MTNSCSVTTGHAAQTWRDYAYGSRNSPERLLYIYVLLARADDVIERAPSVPRSYCSVSGGSSAVPRQESLMSQVKHNVRDDPSPRVPE